MSEQDLAAELRMLGVWLAYLFGSRATGLARPDSDADVAVLARAPLTLRDRLHLATVFARELGVEDVDIVVLDEATLELRGRVMQERKILFSDDEPARVAYEVKTRSEWFDYEPTHRMLTAAYLRRVATKGL